MNQECFGKVCLVCFGIVFLVEIRRGVNRGHIVGFHFKLSNVYQSFTAIDNVVASQFAKSHREKQHFGHILQHANAPVRLRHISHHARVYLRAWARTSLFLAALRSSIDSFESFIIFQHSHRATVSVTAWCYCFSFTQFPMQRNTFVRHVKYSFIAYLILQCNVIIWQ